MEGLLRKIEGSISSTAAVTIALHVTSRTAMGGLLAYVLHGEPICREVPHYEWLLLVSAGALPEGVRLVPLTAPSFKRGNRKLLLETYSRPDKGSTFRFHAMVCDK